MNRHTSVSKDTGVCGSSGGQSTAKRRHASSQRRRDSGRRELDFAGGLVDRLDADVDRIAETERAAAAAADQGRAEVVELEVVAGKASGGQEAFEHLAEAREQT